MKLVICGPIICHYPVRVTSSCCHRDLYIFQLWIGDAVCSAWGGLRGALALLLSLSLKYVFTREDEERAHQNLLLVSGCVLFSVIIQGTTFPPLAKQMMIGRDDRRISFYRHRQKKRSVRLLGQRTTAKYVGTGCISV